MNLPIKQNSKAAVYEILDEFKNGQEFPGIFLQKEILRERGRSVVNINKARSIYKVIG